MPYKDEGNGESYTSALEQNIVSDNGFPAEREKQRFCKNCGMCSQTLYRTMLP